MRFVAHFFMFFEAVRASQGRVFLWRSAGSFRNARPKVVQPPPRGCSWGLRFHVGDCDIMVACDICIWMLCCCMPVILFCFVLFIFVYICMCHVNVGLMMFANLFVRGMFVYDVS